MRVLLDENVDRRLKRLFDDEFEVETVTERGWSGKSNSELLRMAEQEFDALITMDRNMEHQQDLSRFKLGVVLITAKSNQRSDVEPALPEVNRALKRIQSGKLAVVAG
jgi:predicted nuclease of predicted toxin-antitoxin system